MARETTWHIWRNEDRGSGEKEERMGTRASGRGEDSLGVGEEIRDRVGEVWRGQ